MSGICVCSRNPCLPITCLTGAEFLGQFSGQVSFLQSSISSWLGVEGAVSGAKERCGQAFLTGTSCPRCGIGFSLGRSGCWWEGGMEGWDHHPSPAALTDKYTSVELRKGLAYGTYSAVKTSPNTFSLFIWLLDLLSNSFSYFRRNGSFGVWSAFSLL